MKCPFITGEKVRQCSAVTCTVVLSGCELGMYCESSKYRDCPVYRAYLRKEAKLSLTEYSVIYSVRFRNGDDFGDWHKLAG